MSDFLANPTATGLLGGLAVVVFNFVWKRVMGSDEKSLPVQLAEINVKLASIETTLRLIQNDAEHSQRDHEELKEDFWTHMERYHGGDPGTAPRPRRRALQP